MCEHGRMLDLGEFCSECPGPRDRGGMVAASQCPYCGWGTATPWFPDGEYTTVVLICRLCGGES